MIVIQPTTQHRNTQAMMFYLLEKIDYSKSWEDIEYDLGYILGDYNFQKKECYQKVRKLAKSIWDEMHGFINSEGNCI